jgi:hypothetical protein
VFATCCFERQNGCSSNRTNIDRRSIFGPHLSNAIHLGKSMKNHSMGLRNKGHATYGEVTNLHESLPVCALLIFEFVYNGSADLDLLFVSGLLAMLQ